MRFDDGVFKPISEPSNFERIAEDNRREALFLDLLAALMTCANGQLVLAWDHALRGHQRALLAFMASHHGQTPLRR